jgi:AraC family transcriptional regulator
MKTALQFLNNESHTPSECGETLVIEDSSRELGWEGVLLEKGWSPHFYPQNVVTPYFYFAMALERQLEWEVEEEGHSGRVAMVPGEIWLNPPWKPFTHNVDDPCYFTILAIEEPRMAALGSIDLGEHEFLNNYNISDDYLSRLIEMFHLEVKGGGRNGKPFVEQLLTVFCRYFIRNYSSRAGTISPPRIGPEELQIIQSFVMQNIDDVIAMDDMAAELNMSKFHFLREFKKATGKTPLSIRNGDKVGSCGSLVAGTGAFCS